MKQVFVSVFAEIGCVLEGIKINNLGVGVLAKKSVCLEVFKVILLVVV